MTISTDKTTVLRVISEAVSSMMMTGTDPSSLDAEYEKAVSSGNTLAAESMLLDAAAKAMPDTKVATRSGLPLVVYHNTDWDGNGAFRTDGAYFTTKRDPECYYGKNELRVFLNVVNPYEFDIMTDLPADVQTAWEGGDLENLSADQIREAGYDGVTTIEDGIHRHGEDWFFTTRPEQIKSATVTYDDSGNLIPLSKRFDFSNPDIRY